MDYYRQEIDRLVADYPVGQAPGKSDEEAARLLFPDDPIARATEKQYDQIYARLKRGELSALSLMARYAKDPRYPEVNKAMVDRAQRERERAIAQALEKREADRAAGKAEDIRARAEEVMPAFRSSRLFRDLGMGAFLVPLVKDRVTGATEKKVKRWETEEQAAAREAAKARLTERRGESEPASGLFYPRLGREAGEGILQKRQPVENVPPSTHDQGGGSPPQPPAPNFTGGGAPGSGRPRPEETVKPVPIRQFAVTGYPLSPN